MKNNDRTVLYAQGNGNVGIGTVTPNQDLHIYEDLTGTNGTTAVTIENNARSWQLGAKAANENGRFIIYDATA